MAQSKCALSFILDLSFFSHVKTFVDELLPMIGKFLRTVRDLLSSNIKASLIIFDNKILQQKVRILLLSLKEGFLKACTDLAKYAIDESIVSGVRGDQSTTLERRRKYFDVCDERLKRCISQYNDFCKTAGELVTQIRQEVSDLDDRLKNVQGNERSHSFWSKVGYVASVAGIIAVGGSLGVAAAPVTVPVAILLGVGATGSTAVVGGLVGGKIASNSQTICKHDIDVLHAALEELRNLQNIMGKASTKSKVCKVSLRSSQHNLQSFQVILDEEKPKNEQDIIKSITELSQEELNYILKEIKEKMEKLLCDIHTAESDTDKSLDDLPAVKTPSTDTT